MRCPACGFENASGIKFCGECGASLKVKCSSCGFENAPTIKFCGECGQNLADTPSRVSSPKPRSYAPKHAADRILSEQASTESLGALDGERKTITALFADIKGSMELIEDLDPEAAQAIVDPALKIMMDAVHRYDGYVAQSTGDGIFALFGAPVAHEDHPQRALYAALRMQDEIRRYSDHLRADGHQPIQARVGANTGEVVMRSVSTGEHAEYLPVGHSTSLAARMQTLAPIGSIAITSATQKLVEGYFQLKALGPARVKGVSEPVEVYEVTGLGPLRTRLQRSASRGYTKFVGRIREMDAMKAAAEQAKSGHGQIVAAMAEAGVGKSRLFFEFKASSQSGWLLLETFSVSHGKASAYLPVIDLLHSYFKIAGEDDARARREKVNGKVLTLDRSLEDAIPHLFALLGIAEAIDPLAQMDPQIRKRRTLDTIKRLLLRESLNQPLMLIFEDLHWIDEATQELLNLLADSIGTAKILLLVNYRPEYSHSWGSKTYYTQLRLDPLGKESAGEMLSALLGVGAELSPLKRVIIERTEGNPFFMEETVQVLLDEGALVRDGNAVRLTRPLSELKIPPTVQGIIASRIDRLPPAEKELLQTLAVAGMDFPASVIRQVVTRPEPEIQPLLSNLQLAEFIYEQPAFPDIEYTFKHALTHDVAYNSVLIERRKLLHERVGRAIEALFIDKIHEHLDDLAHHYVRSANRQKAVEYLRVAGEQAVQRYANDEAISRFTSALELLKTMPDTPERARDELMLQTNLGPVLIAAMGNGTQEVGAVYTRAVELARQLGEDAQLFPVLFGLRSFHLVRGELQFASEMGEELLSLAGRLQDPGCQLEAYLARGNSLFFFGEFAAAMENLERAFALYDPQKHRVHALVYGLEPGAFCLQRMTYVLLILGYPDQGKRKSEDAVALARQQSHPLTLATAFTVASLIHSARGEWLAAQQQAEAAIALCAEHGFSSILAQGTFLRGEALAKQGRGEEAIALLRRSAQAARNTGARLFETYVLTMRADACLTAERSEQGLSAVDRAIAIMGKTGERFLEAEVYRLRGRLLLMQDASDAVSAERTFREAVEVARRQSAKSFELRATTSLAQLLKKQGKKDEARQRLAEIYGWFTEGFDTADLRDAKALLDELS